MRKIEEGRGKGKSRNPQFTLARALFAVLMRSQICPLCPW